MDRPALYKHLSWLQDLLLAAAFICAPWPLRWIAIVHRSDYTPLGISSLQLFPSDAFLVLWCLACFFRPSVKAGCTKWIMAALFVLPAIAFASVAWAIDSEIALLAAARLLLASVVAATIRVHPPNFKVIFGAVIVSMLFQSTIALYQLETQQKVGLTFLGERDIDSVGAVVKWDGNRRVRGYGLTGHPNIAGGVIAALLLTAAGMLSAPRRRFRLLLWGCLTIALGGVIATFSRSAWLGFGVGALFIVACALKGRVGLTFRRNWIWPALIVCALSAYLLETQWEMITTRVLDSEPVKQRFVQYEIGIGLIAERPLTGVGMGNAVEATDWSEITRIPIQRIHNLPILVSAELGIGAGLIWCFVMIAPAVIGWRLHQRDQLSPWALGLTAALVCYAVTDLLDMYSFHSLNLMPRWLWLGLWMAAVETDARRSASPLPADGQTEPESDESDSRG